MSTIAVDLTFNMSGRFMKKNWSRLTPDAVEVVVYLDDWYHQEQRLAQLYKLDDAFEELTYFSIIGDNSN